MALHNTESEAERPEAAIEDDEPISDDGLAILPRYARAHPSKLGVRCRTARDRPSEAPELLLQEPGRGLILLATDRD